jgi:hypothetical protein
MPPVFRSGRCTRILFNDADLSSILNDAERSYAVDTHEVTAFATSTGGCTTDKAYIGGHRDATLSVSGMAQTSTDAVQRTVEAALQSSTKQHWSIGFGGSTVGGPADLVMADVTDFTVTAPTADVVAVSADSQASLARSGRWLISPVAATTSTGAFAGVVDYSTAVGTSTNGALVHLHVTSATTSTGSVKVQHSTDGATWADLATLTFSSGPSVTASTLTGSVKEQVRGRVHQLSTAGATIGLAFARHYR